MRAAPGLGDVDGRDLGTGDVMLREQIAFKLVAGDDAAGRLDRWADLRDGANVVEHGLGGARDGRAGVEGGDDLLDGRRGAFSGGRHDYVEVGADDLAPHAGLAGVRLVDEDAVPSLAELVDEGEGLVGLGEGGLGRLRSLDDSGVVVLARVVAVLGLFAVRLAARGLLGLALAVRVGAVASEVTNLVAVVALRAGRCHRFAAGLGDLLEHFEAALAVGVVRVVARVGAQVVAVRPALAHDGDALLVVLEDGVVGAAVVAADDALLRARLVAVRLEVGLLGGAAAIVVASPALSVLTSPP